MDAGPVDELLGALARQCAAEFTGFPPGTVPDLRAQVPELDAVPVIAAQVERMAVEHSRAIHRLLCRPIPRGQVRPAPFTAAFARDCAHWDVPAATVLRAYQRGHELLWHWWSGQVERRLTDPAERSAVTARLAELLMAYVSVGMALTVEVHTAEREARTRGDSWRQRDTVLAILDGASPRAESSRRLGYELAGWHTAFVLWSPPDAPDDWVGLETEARAWAMRAGGRPPLLVPVDGRAIWGWVAGDAVPSRALPEPGDGLRVALGDPGLGLAGFRDSHREAVRARSLATASGRTGAVVRHAELATVALLREDPEQLRRYVTRALGGLAAPGARERRLRATVSAYLAAGENVRAAARALHFHRNTVQQRLELAARLRGRPLDQDRLALALALEIIAADAGGT